MRSLFRIIYLYRAFFTFLLFEILCAWIIATSNLYQSSILFNSANALSGKLFRIRDNIGKYLSLSWQNNDLARENAFLRRIITESAQKGNLITSGNLAADSTWSAQYDFIPARVINNSVRRTNNFLTIDKGSDEGIEPGMGVISSWGIVGKVRAASSNYSTVYSLLHSEMMISSLITANGVICTTSWTGEDPLYSDLLYVPRHLNISKGDSVVTSGFSSMYPRGIPIGIIDSYWISENETFYHIKIKLANDFFRLAYVYVIKNKLKAEKDSLEQVTAN
jgi:rod shape-determining protein MreC